jgi:hypothetical protein
MKKITNTLAFLLSVFAFSAAAQAQSTRISTEYLMTIHIPTERKAIDPTLTIVNVMPGGTFKGPGIQGKIIAPSGDWLRTMPQAPRQVYVVHGEADAADTLRSRIERELNMRAMVPEQGSVWPL